MADLVQAFLTLEDSATRPSRSENATQTSLRETTSSHHVLVKLRINSPSGEMDLLKI
jgi:hypothetical protein